MDIRLTVQVDGMYFNGGASIKIDEQLYYDVFEPVKTCDDMMLAVVTGDSLIGSKPVERKLVLRKHAAKDISEAITKLLIMEMSKKDTHNGY